MFRPERDAFLIFDQPTKENSPPKKTMESKNNMSNETEYESYSETCKVYDIRREAIGVEYISEAVDQVRPQKTTRRNAIQDTRKNRLLSPPEERERILFF